MTPTSSDSSDSSHGPDLRHMVRRVENGDVELHAEALLRYGSSGDQNRAPVILLSEAEAPSTRWPQSLLDGLAERTGGIIWFDTRDCGRSSYLDDPYVLEDLTADVLTVLDAFSVDRAHVLGRSMGGQIAQQLALAVPQRVVSLTLLSTTPGRREEFGLPEDWLIDKMTERLFKNPPLDSAGRSKWLVEQQEWFSGPVFTFDRAAALAAAASEVAECWRGPNGHGAAVVDAPDIADYLGHIAVPSLVVHGSADPVYPAPHAQALAERLQNAQLVLVEGLGHELPAGFVAQLLELMDRHVLDTTEKPRSPPR